MSNMKIKTTNQGYFPYTFIWYDYSSLRRCGGFRISDNGQPRGNFHVFDIPYDMVNYLQNVNIMKTRIKYYLCVCVCVFVSNTSDYSKSLDGEVPTRVGPAEKSFNLHLLRVSRNFLTSRS